jgi:hypothetical protein
VQPGFGSQTSKNLKKGDAAQKRPLCSGAILLSTSVATPDQRSDDCTSRMPPKPKKLNKKQMEEQAENERRAAEQRLADEQGSKEAEEVARHEAEALAKRETDRRAKIEAERKRNNPTMEELVELHLDRHGTLWLNEKRLNRRRPDELQLLGTAIGENSRLIDSVTLYGNSLTDLQFTELLPGLRKLRRLKELRLDHNDLTELSCEAVSMATSFWPNLERIYFEDNHGMSGDSIADFFMTWKGPPERSTGLLGSTSAIELTLDELNLTRKSRMKRKILEDVERELRAIYQEHNLASKEKNIPRLLQKYVGREQVMLQRVRDKYAAKQAPRRMAWD